jgi:hypothetical protein
MPDSAARQRRHRRRSGLDHQLLQCEHFFEVQFALIQLFLCLDRSAVEPTRLNLLWCVKPLRPSNPPERQKQTNQALYRVHELIIIRFIYFMVDMTSRAR